MSEEGEGREALSSLIKDAPHHQQWEGSEVRVDNSLLLLAVSNIP